MEKVYKRISSAGVWDIVFGIVTLVVGITTGVMLVINGAKLLGCKRDMII